MELPTDFLSLGWGSVISDVHTGAYPISVLWSEMDDFS